MSLALSLGPLTMSGSHSHSITCLRTTRGEPNGYAHKQFVAASLRGGRAIWCPSWKPTIANPRDSREASTSTSRCHKLLPSRGSARMPSAGASSSSSPSPPSTALPVPVKLRRSTQEMFEDCHDATGTMDECLCEDVSDRRAHGHSHIGAQRNYSCQVLASRSKVPQSSAPTFHRLGSCPSILNTRYTSCHGATYCWPMALCCTTRSSEFLGANVIKNDFHVAHFRGCPALFNKNTFEPDLETKSLFVSGITQDCKDWVLEVIITKSFFLRVFTEDKTASFAMMPTMKLQSVEALHLTYS